MKTILVGFVGLVALVALLGMPAAARADRVAFVNGQRGLFVVPAEGDKPVQLVPQIDDVNGAAFSPDGARLAVDGGPGNHHGLWLLSVADRSRPPPPELDRGTDPRWSPDGTRIGYGCFLEHQNGEGEERYFSPGGLCVVAADGRGKRLLTTSGRGGVLAHGWSKDGREIVWSEVGDADQTFYAIAADGGASRKLLVVSHRGIVWPGAVSADLRRYVWVADGRIHVASLEGAAETSFGKIGREGAWCRLAPDGTRVACAVETGKRWQIQVYDAAGGQAQVVADGAEGVKPLWSPDGAKLVYTADDGLYVIDRQGGKPLRLFRGGDDDVAIAWIK